MKEIKRDNAVINYNVVGKGNTTLLFVHGSYINQLYWNEQVNYFMHNYTVVTLDLPGHGLSGRERKHWSTNGFSDDIIALIKELELKNIILVGHSWGADVSLLAATKYPQPIIGFVAVDYYKNAATPVLPPDQIDAVKRNLEENFADTNENYCRTALLTPETPAKITSRVVEDYRDAYKPMGQAIMPEVFEMYKTQQDLLPALKFKLYLMNVDYQLTNEEPLKRYCKQGYTVTHLKGTSHFPMIEDPLQFNKKLEQVIHEINNSK